MRVVAGSARGRNLRSPEGEGTRPTSDRVREAVFNALLSRGPIAGTRVVDLFAGSGALGIEAISRGAADVWFVESDRDAVAVIEHNLDTLEFRDRATIVSRPVEDAIPELPDEIDLVLADPPYAFDGWVDLLERLAPLADEGAVIVIESDRSVTLPGGWEKMRERTYGGTVITFTAPPAGTTGCAAQSADPPDATGADA
jgi:16S rRNA (guanine966-N2)-methyltransferase